MSKNVKLMQGNEACVEGALAAGMTFYAGYPITPSTEIAEISSLKLPQIGGKFIQMEDEIAGMAATIGGSLAGLKSMTATSGPGFSLKQENIGYACIAEIPCVIVNVQRGGPSTGLPTSPSQGDVMQAKWGTHGDHPVIALSPSSVKETFDLTVKCFNYAEKYRTPVILLLDEVVAHMRERIEIPDASEIEVVDRKKPKKNLDTYNPYEIVDDTLIPPMAAYGEGYRFHVTGLSHNITGFPSNDSVIAENLLNRLMDKISNNIDDLSIYENYKMEDAEVVIVAYGSTARSAKSAVDAARKEGLKVGLFRPMTIWPFLAKQIEEIDSKVKNIVVAEMNLGQYSLEVERVCKSAKVSHYGKVNGELITPDEILTAVKEAL
ncbi:2-oxoacid:acceptor oxidoreductase subunit alpha [Clostridiaceae bacterium M8S5]|nr:2-oxoacid:acceptor oxidoreductase subunit alpha [Clostridiaceae bacterium M8S5]